MLPLLGLKIVSGLAFIVVVFKFKRVTKPKVGHKVVRVAIAESVEDVVDINITMRHAHFAHVRHSRAHLTAYSEPFVRHVP